MKVANTILPLLFTSIVTAKSLSFFGDTQKVISEEVSVPGSNPLEYCQEDQSTDILEIYHVNLLPNPPVAGQNLTIEAAGYFRETVEEGAYVNLQVKYGLIRLVNTKADLCEQIKNVDLECPLEEGEMMLTKEIALPKEIPPGKYTVLADIYTKDGDKITCLTAHVQFGMS